MLQDILNMTRQQENLCTRCMMLFQIRGRTMIGLFMKKQVFCLVSAIACSLIWGVNLAVDLYFGQSNDLLIFLHGFCAVVWTLAAVAWAFRIRRARRGPNEKEAS